MTDQADPLTPPGAPESAYCDRRVIGSASVRPCWNEYVPGPSDLELRHLRTRVQELEQERDEALMLWRVTAGNHNPDKLWTELLELQGPVEQRTREAAFLRIYARFVRSGKHWDTAGTMANCLENIADNIDRRAEQASTLPGELHSAQGSAGASLFPRIWRLNDLASGQPCVRGTRIIATFLAERFAGGESIQALADEYAISATAVEDAVRLVVAASAGSRGTLARTERRMEALVPLETRSDE